MKKGGKGIGKKSSWSKTLLGHFCFLVSKLADFDRERGATLRHKLLPADISKGGKTLLPLAKLSIKLGNGVLPMEGRKAP